MSHTYKLGKLSVLNHKNFEKLNKMIWKKLPGNLKLSPEKETLNEIVIRLQVRG